MTTEVHFNLADVQKMFVAHQTALMSFCVEWARAYPDKVEEGAAFLTKLEAEYDLPAGTFSKATRALRGETDLT